MMDHLLLLALAAWVGADTTAALQLMISQPLVAAWIAGSICGSPAAGLAAGVVLQLAWGRSLPLGGSSFPSAGPAGVVAGAVAARHGEAQLTALGGIVIPDAWCLALAIALGLGVGELGRPGVQMLRRRRGALVARTLASVSAGSSRGLVTATILGATQSALLGMALVAVGLGLGSLGLAALRDLPPERGVWVLYAALGAGLGHGFTSLAPRRSGRIAAGLIAVGALAWSLFR